MFWKKKSKPEVEIKYSCLAPNYLEVINDEEGENLDDFKNQMFAKLEPKIFTKAEIDSITKDFEFDVWKAFHWIDHEWEKEEMKTSIGVKERLKSFLPSTTDEQQQKILQHLNFTNFYPRTIIQTASHEVGFDVYKSCEWESYSEITRTFPSKDNYQVTFYKKVKKD